MNRDPELAAADRLDFTAMGGGADGTTCALLTPAIKAHLRRLNSGDVLEVRVRDPAARDDILSWSRLTGHAVLAMVDDYAQTLRFYVRKK